jgi:hypothetical protein
MALGPRPAIDGLFTLSISDKYSPRQDVAKSVNRLIHATDQIRLVHSKAEFTIRETRFTFNQGVRRTNGYNQLTLSDLCLLKRDFSHVWVVVIAGRHSEPIHSREVPKRRLSTGHG